MFSKLFTLDNSKYSSLSLNENSTQIEINKWEASRFVVEKLVPITGYSPYPLDELIMMVGSVCRFNPTHIFEWGTHIGKSARIFYETIQNFKINAEVYSFDLPDESEHVEHPHGLRGKLVKGLKGVHLYQEDGLVKSIEIFRSSSIENKRALFYVDGDHSYESVYKELLTILSTVPEAIVLLHDTFYQSYESNYNIGPNLAINDVLNNLPAVFNRIDTQLGLPGMTLIYK